MMARRRYVDDTPNVARALVKDLNTDNLISEAKIRFPIVSLIHTTQLENAQRMHDILGIVHSYVFSEIVYHSGWSGLKVFDWHYLKNIQLS